MKHKFGLLPKVLLAIALGIVFGLFVPEWFTRIALTFNNIFGNFLNFVIPLLILGLVAPGIADLGSKAGRLLVITAALAYAFTLFSGFGTFFTSLGVLPRLLGGTEMSAPGETAATPPATVLHGRNAPVDGRDDRPHSRLRAGTGHGLHPQRQAQGHDG